LALPFAFIPQIFPVPKFSDFASAPMISAARLSSPLEHFLGPPGHIFRIIGPDSWVYSLQAL
jgi:hypothetical protein